jgi:hypothetical protein
MMVLAAALPCLMAGCGKQHTPATTSSPASPEESRAAIALAGVQAGHQVSSGNPLVATIAHETSALARRCRERAIRIDGIAGFVSNELQTQGNEVRPLAVSNAHSFDCQQAAFSDLALRRFH